MKIKCTMWKEQIDNLTINHSLAPLLAQKWMRALDAKEMKHMRSFPRFEVK